MFVSLPYETGYLSQMSHQELLALADDLEHTTFWDNEDAIQRCVERYMRHHWRRPDNYGVVAAAATPSGWYGVDLNMKQQPALSGSTYRNIVVKMPDALDERTARLFAEIQIREQMSPNYDPTEKDV